MKKKLLTWLDIERIIRKKTNNCTMLPDGILRIDFYSDAIEVGIKKAHKNAALKAFKAWFTDWFQEADSFITLDIGKNVVDIEFIEESDEQQFKKVPKPLWHDVAYLKETDADGSPKTFDILSVDPFDSLPEMTAFHSFKGGVGRTTALICYLFGLISKFGTNKKQRILLIDSDLEAPGITYWFTEKDNRPNVSFIDFLEAVHYSQTKDKVHSFFANELKKASISYLNAEIYILPAFTEESQLLDIQILPEHIANALKGNWNYGNEIHDLGKELGVDHVFVDLRAGLSEISSPLLFDPRIERFLVTTVAEQSVRGTGLILRQISKMSSCIPFKDKDDFRTIVPNIILSMLTAELKDSNAYERAITVLNESYDDNDDNTGDLGALQITEAFFDQSILSIANWEEARNKLNKSPMIRIADDWVEDLKTKEAGANKPVFSELIVKQLNETCKKYEFAEKGESEDLLITEPIKNMAKKFNDSLPMIISIGAKGAGKTFGYLQIARFQNWKKFIEKVLGDKRIDCLDAQIFPFSEPENLDKFAKEILLTTRTKALDSLEVDREFLRSDLIKNISQALKNQDWETEEWIDFWTSQMAFTLGMDKEKSTLLDINNYLSEKSVKLIFLFDGLEDIFRDISKNRSKQNAINALFEFPNRIAEIRTPYLGIIIFIRRDYVGYTIHQNRAQFEALYSPYDLTWDSLSFLQLVYWICSQAKIPSFEVEKTYKLGQAEILDALVPLWGRKLGRDNSKEAHTEKWIFAALTDFNGRLQARDIVRILLNASEITLGKTSDIKIHIWQQERILPPVAIRRSMDNCSVKKIAEAGEEYPVFQSWVDKMDREYSKAERTIPFTPDQYGMDSSTIEMLKEMGVIFEYQDKKDGSSKYYMPEIFRTGLKFNLAKGARPKVLALKRKLLGQAF